LTPCAGSRPFDEPQTAHGPLPFFVHRVEDDAPDVIVREPVGGRVDPHWQLLGVDGRRWRQHQPDEQGCRKTGD